jgi:tetratricopeptide (TPR) repeat protein
MTVRSPQNPIRRFVCIVAAILSCCGAYSVIARAYAEWLARSSAAVDLDRALKLAPGNAAYWLRRADLLDRDLTSPVNALERAAALNPFDADIWIRLGLDAEARGNFPKAESCFLQSARVSRRYQARWTLANYYFRRGAAAEFWAWTRQALDLEPADAAALFQLCWKMSASSSEIFERGIPANRKVWRNYSRFLLAQNRIDAAGYVIGRLLSDAQPDDRDLLLEASDRFLASHAIELASAAWNALCDRKLMTCASIHPSGGMSLNDAPDARALGHGFAWHIGKSPGLTASIRPGVASVEFSGSEPENVEILWRWIPVKPRQRWLLRFDYQTSGISPRSGLAWQVLAGGNSTPLGSSPSLSSPVWREGAIRFEAPAGIEAVRLLLSYSRLPGEVRIEGSMSTRAMRLEIVP